jgi:hypothetical protein
LAALSFALVRDDTTVTVATRERQISADPDMLAIAPPELRNELTDDPFDYFRFVNRPWIVRVCEIVDKVFEQTIVRLHGDPHVEQFAVSADAWGLDAIAFDAGDRRACARRR